MSPASPRPSAGPATALERFLIRARAGSRGLAIWRSPAPRAPVDSELPQADLSSRALEWLASCEEAARRWEACPGPREEPPMELRVVEASSFGPAATRLTRLALEMGIQLAGALAQIAVFLRGEGRRFSKPAFGEAAERRQAKWARRARDLSMGPQAHGPEAVYHARPPAPEAPVAAALERPGAVFPAATSADEVLLAAVERSGGGRLSPHELRVFIALHEASHVALAFQSATFFDYFGLGLASAPSAQALRALLWPGPPCADARVSAEEDSVARGGHFEYAARSIFMESHADCLAALAFGEGQPSRVKAMATLWIGVRSEFIDADKERYDSPAGARLTHDSREALRELIRACDRRIESGASFNEPPGGARELASRCALTGLSRWIGQIARLSRPGLVASSLQRKLQELAPAPDESALKSLTDLAWVERLRAPFAAHPGPAAPRLAAALKLLAPLEREFGLGDLVVTGALAPPEPPKAAPELGPILIRRAARRLGLCAAKATPPVSPPSGRSP